jgi:hypothetical protein
MVTSEHQATDSDSSRKTIVIVVAVIAALAIALIFYVLLRATGGGSPPPTLQSAIRPGSPDWDQNISKIVLDDPEADEARRALGDIVMTIHSTVRNFSGRTLDGLEVKGTVVDHQGKPVKEKTVIVIPTDRQPELGPNKTMLANVSIDGFKESDDRANIKMEVTGFRFKQ